MFSAGIGRTGVFITVHNLLTKMRQLLWDTFQLKFDIRQTVMNLRTERPGMVQTKVNHVKMIYL